MYMRHWLQSPSRLTHGNIIKREIFSKRTEDSTPSTLRAMTGKKGSL